MTDKLINTSNNKMVVAIAKTAADWEKVGFSNGLKKATEIMNKHLKIDSKELFILKVINDILKEQMEALIINDNI